ncbi:hypothetical protein BGX26_004762 [Mortierella sp. AD094]|nr:hypothetical protein BGX26_004762 [Mortierella sp. AD094]
MWNDPDLDDNCAQPRSDARDRRSRNRRQKEEDKKEDLSAFGYESFLFHNDSTADAIEQGQLLITWQGQDPEDEDTLWLDRYDVRNLLDDKRLFTGLWVIQDDNFLQEASDLDDERFHDLDSDEEILFDMDEDEREEHIVDDDKLITPLALAQKREENEPSQYKGMQYEYDKDKSENPEEPIFRIHFDVPEGMTVPDSEKTFALIERTAKFVNNSSEPTMEIILQAKQATNPNFAFMSRRHHLFQFYKHVRWLMQTGLYESAEDARQREAEEAKAEEEEEARRAAEAARAREAALHVDIEMVIGKTVEFLTSNDSIDVFERRLLSLDDPRFGFMKPGHAWHEYFVRKRLITKEAQARTADAVEASASAPTDIEMEYHDPTMANSCQSKEQELLTPILPLNMSSKEARVAEMRKLDRLQRIEANIEIKLKIKVKVKVKLELALKIKIKFSFRSKVRIKVLISKF